MAADQDPLRELFKSIRAVLERADSASTPAEYLDALREIAQLVYDLPRTEAVIREHDADLVKEIGEYFRDNDEYIPNHWFWMSYTSAEIREGQDWRWSEDPMFEEPKPEAGGA